MLNKFGQGKIEIGDDNYVHYHGSCPPELVGQDVYMISKQDLELIIHADVSSLMATRRNMPDELYNCNQPESLPDEIVLVYRDRTTQKMFLDRNIYSPSFKDIVWVRYVSVDQSFMEENENEQAAQVNE